CTYVRTLSTTWDGNTLKTELAIPSDRESANTVGNQTGNELGIQSIRDGHDEIRYSLGLGSGSFGCDWRGYTIAGSTSSGTFVIRIAWSLVNKVVWPGSCSTASAQYHMYCMVLYGVHGTELLYGNTGRYKRGCLVAGGV
ncbi:hypothetical protein O988_00496, partial [Pseudogymnoascus sp. VKM F-3808]